MEKETEEIQDLDNHDGNSVVNKEDETAQDANSQKDDKDAWIDYKARYSSSTKEANRLTTVHKSYRDVLRDNSQLLELPEDIAKDVVKQLFEDWYSETDDLDELVKMLNSWDEIEYDDKSTKVDEKALAKRIRAEILDEQQQEEAEKVLDKALKKFDEEVRTKYLDEFHETIGKRKLTPSLAEREIWKIIAYANKDQSRKDKADEKLSNLASTKLWGYKSETSTTMTIAKLDMMWMPKAQQRALYSELYPKQK